MGETLYISQSIAVIQIPKKWMLFTARAAYGLMLPGVQKPSAFANERHIDYNPGLGRACEISQEDMEYDHARITRLSQRLMNAIFSELSHVIRNGDPVHTYPGQFSNQSIFLTIILTQFQAVLTCLSRTWKASRC